ncbi:MAG TPA: LuxR C-terminal-related transcriptional regulator [Nevskiaceae bacterium]|nr:LuxR C-terminal-related transcriptional regulator [Nevskiaceae bacterium]
MNPQDAGTGDPDTVRLTAWLYESALELPVEQFLEAALGRLADAFELLALRCWRTGAEGRAEPGRGHGAVQDAPSDGRLEALLPAGWLRLHGDLPLAWQVDVQPRRPDAPRMGLLQVLLEHLHRAERLAHRQSLRLQAAGAASQDPDAGLALCDPQGRLLNADTAFRRHLEAALPGWDGQALPFPLVWTETLARHGLVYRGLFVRVQRVEDHFHLRVRPDRRNTEFSQREMQIAEQVARGLTFREIGETLGLAPSTVSSHLYNLYAKLGLRRRAELVEWLGRRRELAA